MLFEEEQLPSITPNQTKQQGEGALVPLAESMRPVTPDELLGQEHVWSPGSPLWKMASEDKLFSVILWGPPGTGKTSLSHLIGRMTGRKVCMLSAVSDGVKAIREVLAASRTSQSQGQKAHLLFMDELHRLNRAQQDVLLPALEAGWIRFIGATTENPSFEVNSAILSRSLTFALQSIPSSDLEKILMGTLKKKNIPTKNAAIIEAISHTAAGDARKALNILDALLATYSVEEFQAIESIPESLFTSGVRYDKDRDQHYDCISAYIKSIRASHPDAALYYLARMLEGGEDPMFIARRLVIAASEDIGNANPQALILASSAATAIHQIGMPEARILLSQVTTYLAASAKSNASYVAMDQALEEVRKKPHLPIPFHLRNAPTKFMKMQGYGKGYIYPHDCKKGEYRYQAYLPGEVDCKNFYTPKPVGVEQQFIQNLNQLKPTQD